MSSPKSIKDTLLWKKTEELVESINDFSHRIPNGSLYDLDSRLRRCVEDLPGSIENCFRQSSGVGQLRSIIKAGTFLEECKDYLKLVECLQYGETNNLISRIEEIREMMMMNTSAFKGMN